MERFSLALLTKYVLASSRREILSAPAWKARGGPGPLSPGVREPFSSTLDPRLPPASPRLPPTGVGVLSSQGPTQEQGWGK